MPLITQGKANLKYILIVVVLAVIVGGGILAWQYWQTQKSVFPEVEPPAIEYYIEGYLTPEASNNNTGELKDMAKDFQAEIWVYTVTTRRNFEISSLTEKNCIMIRDVLDTLEYVQYHSKCKIRAEYPIP